MSPQYRKSSRKRVVLTAEALEDRVVPAGNVTAILSGGVLHIFGDDQANRIWVAGAGENAAVVATLDGTTINGRRAAVRFEGIDFAYDIKLHDGNDFLYVTGLTGNAGLFADTGEGNDGAAIDNSCIGGLTVITTGTGDDTVSVGMGKQFATTFNLGAGDDRIDIAGTEFGDVVFNGGAGTNRMGLLGVRWTRVPLVTGFDTVFPALMPTARNDRVATEAGEAVTVNVLANDSAGSGILDPSTVQLTGLPDSGTARVNPNGTITYTASATAEGVDSFTYTVRNSTGAISNEATVVISLGTIPDTTGPVPTITTTATSPTGLAQIPFTITFDENVTGFDQSDVAVTNGTVSNFVAVNATTFTFDVAPTADGAVVVSVAAGAAQDASGNNSSAASTTIQSDRTSPTTTISSTFPDPSNVSPIPITVVFSEAVTGFTAADVVVTNGTISGFAGSGDTYTFNLAPTADGLVTVDVAAGVANDAAGNPNAAATQFTIVFDQTAPSLTLSTTAGSPTNLSPIPVTATFSQAVTGFDISDINVTNGTVSNFAGSGTTYTFDVTPTADGDVIVNVGSDAAIDGAGNGNTAASPLTVTSDTTAPTAVVSSTSSDPTSTNPIPFTVTFSESVTGLTAGDILVVNGAVMNFSGSGTTYTFDVVPSGGGVTVSVSVPADVSEDAATNGNTASNTLTRDFTGSTVSTTITTSASDPTNLAVIPFTVTFGETVTGFDATDVTVLNGTVSNFAGSGSVYTFDVTPTADGPVILDIGAGAATGVSTSPTSAASYTITSDQTDPVVTNDLASSGAVTGTASDASGVTGTQVSIFDGTNYWSGTLFDSATEVFHAATSSDSFATWSYAISVTGTFTLHSIATDAAGNTGEDTDSVVLS